MHCATQVDGLNPTMYLQLGPMAKIMAVHPVTNYSEMAVGLALLDDSVSYASLAHHGDGHLKAACLGKLLMPWPSTAAWDVQAIPEDLDYAAQGRMTLRGPNMLYRERVLALIGGVAVYVPDVSPNETFGFPDDVPHACPDYMASQCYWPATRSKFWGFVW